MDIKLLDIIACPVCKGKLSFNKETNELICKFDRLAYPIVDGIPALLQSSARQISVNEDL
ncbi:MAG: Trm112 family protein [Psychromonas sp.]|nr:Trm112 family protein [Psychromonas sp.]